MLLRGANAPRIAGVILICGTGEAAVEVEGARRLELRFDDVEVAAEDREAGLRAWARRKFAAEVGRAEVGNLRGHHSF